MSAAETLEDEVRDRLRATVPASVPALNVLSNITDEASDLSALQYPSVILEWGGWTTTGESSINEPLFVVGNALILVHHYVESGGESGEARRGTGGGHDLMEWTRKKLLGFGPSIAIGPLILQAEQPPTRLEGGRLEFVSVYSVLMTHYQE